MAAKRGSPFSGYWIAVATVLAALLVRFLLEPVLRQSAPFLLSTVAVMLSAWYGGLGPGLLATGISAFLDGFLFLRPASIGIPGSRHLVEMLLFLAVGSVLSILSGALRSARLRAENNAAEAEAARERVHDILTSVGDAFAAVDANWRFTFLNDRVAALARTPRHELLGTSFFDVFPEAAGFGPLRRAMAAREAVHFETLYDPLAIWIQVDAYPSKDGLSIVSRDITERKRAEDTRAWLAAIVESSADGIIGKDLDGIIVSWNAGAQQIYGYGAEEALGRPFSILLPPESAGEFTDIVGQLRRGERIINRETVRITKGGRKIHVSLTVSPVCNSAGQITGAAAIERDVTDRVEMEARLRERHKLESLGVLAGGIAHDFNNLLTGIMGNASLALEGVPAGSLARRQLQEVIGASERAAYLTSQMLAYAGKGRFVTELIDLSKVVRSVGPVILASIPKEVELRLDLAPQLPAVEADAGQLHQVVVNLITNSTEAIPAGTPGTITVRTGVEEIDESHIRTAVAAGDIAPGQYVFLEVHDTGSGMDEETVRRIFDPFFTTKFMGRGLGMAAALGIVRGHRGALEIKSQPGRGTLVRVLLPPAKTRTVAPPVPPASRTELSGEGLVLVVDDEEIVRRAAQATLVRYGYSVLLAESGRQAIEIFKENADRIILVLLDMTMPVMSGEETIQYLKAIRPEVPVIASSGYNETVAIRRFTGNQLASFIQKPYTSAQLAEKLSSVLRASPASARHSSHGA